MGKAPAFQFYAGDFLTGTALMSNAEVGLYIRLLCLQAEHGSIPDDVERIVQAYGESARALWTAVRPKFNPGSTAGTLVNARMVEVLAARDAFRARQSEKGKASAKARTQPPTTEQPRKRRGSTAVQPLEDGDGDGDRREGQEKERARTARGPHPGVQALIDHLTTRLREEGIAQSLDGSAVHNRRAAFNLIRKLGTDYPSFDPVESGKRLIDAALRDPFHRKNATQFAYLFNNCGKIAASSKANGQHGTDDYARQVAAAGARRFGQPADTGFTG